MQDVLNLAYNGLYELWAESLELMQLALIILDELILARLLDAL